MLGRFKYAFKIFIELIFHVFYNESSMNTRSAPTGCK